MAYFPSPLTLGLNKDSFMTLSSSLRLQSVGKKNKLFGGSPFFSGPNR